MRNTRSWAHRGQAGLGLLMASLIVAAGACTADFELYGSEELELTEPDDELSEIVELDEELQEVDEVEELEELADTREDVPAAASCPPSSDYPEGFCFLQLIDEAFVSTTETPVWTWKMTELPTGEYNGMRIDLDVYLENWLTKDSEDRHNFFSAQVAPKGAMTLPNTKLIGVSNTAYPDYVCYESGFTASKAALKLEQNIEAGYWYHLSYVYFPAKQRFAQLNLTRNGVSIQNNEDDFRVATDVARLRVTSTEEVVFTLGYPPLQPNSSTSIGWEYRNLRVLAFGCGDGFVDESEDCDTGDRADSVSCDSDCTFVVCGDNHVNAAVEDCDDGNTVDGDSCPADCKIP